MNNERFQEQQPINRGRFILGVTIFIVGQATTLLIPFVTASGLSSEMKAVLSGTFFFVTPQIGIVWAVAVLGKQGYDRIKDIVLGWLKRYGPPETVGPVRYRIGLIMFITTFIVGLLEPYIGIGRMIPNYEVNQIRIALVLDAMFLASFFVLGGQFWDKVRALFVRTAKMQG